MDVVSNSIDDNSIITENEESRVLSQIAMIIEDDNYGVITKRFFVINNEKNAIENYIYDSEIKPEIIINDTYKDLISYLDLIVENSDLIIGININRAMEIIRREIFKIKREDNVVYNNSGKVIDYNDKTEWEIIKIQEESIITERVRRIQKYYKERQL